MRDTKTLFDTFEDIKTLCQYLYMSEDHEILIHNMINVPLKIYIRDDLEIMCQNMNFPELEPMHLGDATPSKLHDIVCCLKEEPALEFPDNFKNRWDEIENITLANLVLNKSAYDDIKKHDAHCSDYDEIIKQAYEQGYFKVTGKQFEIGVAAGEDLHIELDDGSDYRSPENYLRAHTEIEIIKNIASELERCIRRDVGEEKTNDALLCLMELKERFEYNKSSEKALNYLIENGLNRMESYKNKENIEEERDDI